VSEIDACKGRQRYSGNSDGFVSWFSGFHFRFFLQMFVGVQRTLGEYFGYGKENRCCGAAIVYGTGGGSE
jgi:hypothetical protein